MFSSQEEKQHICRLEDATPLVADSALENAIIQKVALTPVIKLLQLYCPGIARAAQAGQFVVFRKDETAERVPLTIADFSPELGTLTVIIQELGVSTRKLGAMEVGDRVEDVIGPLGVASEIEMFGTVVCIGGGVGIAPVYPIARALREAGNKVISIIGARNRDLLILEDQMRAVSDELLVTTDDGSYGRGGFVTDALKELMASDGKIDRVLAIGPVVMMRAVANTTREAGIKTVVSLNSTMVDGTGMCGGCRVRIGDQIKFTCVDGPEFDGHQVDFGMLMNRLAMYKDREGAADTLHRENLGKDPLTGLEKPKKRIDMPRQEPRARARNFNEVALGYAEIDALMEASRCLQCKKSPCVAGCPVGIDIPAFIKRLRAGDFAGAIQKIKEKNALPAICGRVCPQESQCELQCVLNKKGEPVAIGRLERFLADWESRMGTAETPSLPAPTGKRVAIIGAGPAGLTCAAELAQRGHDVTVFEALHKPGGVLIYGIPEFRLPKAIVKSECDYVRKLGVRIETNYVVGKRATIDDMMPRDGFDAVFVGTGAGLPYFLGIPGEECNGVYSANEFLTRANLMKAYRFPEYDTPIYVGKRVGVVGGGNVAMDSARVALRLGAEKVMIVYRRSRAELPAREEEAENAIEEGIELMTLASPIRVIGDEKGWVTGMECIRMELGEPDDSGRRRPIPVENSEHVIELDTVVVAIGQGPNPVLTSTVPDMDLTRRGNIVADETTGKTSKKGVFAGGDIVTGAATVILAMGAGKSAARAIDQYLKDGAW